MFKLIIFVAASLGLVLLSLPSLRRPRSRGFYRFFAFESLLALTLLNLESWFQDPLSNRQIISWALLLFSLSMAVSGFYVLCRADKTRNGTGRRTAPVKARIYRYIRYPLYSSLFLLGWGIFVKQPSIPGLVLVHAAMFSLIAAAKAEERENLKKFGDDYAVYMKTTKRFIPFVY